MVKNLRIGSGLVLCILLFSFNKAQQPPHTPKNQVVFKGIRTASVPFSYIKSSAIEVVNNKLNISVTDRNGDILQINGISVSKLKKGILPPSEFRTVYMSEKNGTYTDHNDKSPSSLLEITCDNAAPGNTVTVGLKTNLMRDKKTIRAYATISGIIPSYTYTETQQ